MKISNSKKQLAKIISENGGWRGDAESAAQCAGGEISFWYDAATKRHGDDWRGSYLGSCDDIEFTGVKLPNWHQTLLSRDEYFHLYPVAEPAPEPVGVVVENKTTCHLTVTDKPTIEQLAADYRNAKDFADRKQQEADGAKADADAKLAELVAAGKAHGLELSVAEPEPELVITDWRDLQVGDEISVQHMKNVYSKSAVLVVGDNKVAIRNHAGARKAVNLDEVDWKFIRRPAKGEANA